MRNFFQRHFRKITCLIIAIGFVCMFVSVGTIVGGAMYAMRDSEPYQMGWKEVQEDPRVVQALGEPMELGWLVSGSVSYNNGESNGSYEGTVSGPNGRGDLVVVARQPEGEFWYLQELRVELENGETISLRE